MKPSTARVTLVSVVTVWSFWSRQSFLRIVPVQNVFGKVANGELKARDRIAVRMLADAAATHDRRVLHEATVGAGLPIIDTIQKLAESGDQILRIEGSPSGTLGYLLSEMGRGTAFSVALKTAMQLGYTEPDPRDDLSGMDVARKALILGRLIGFSGEIADVEVESLVPEPLRDVPLDVFLKRLSDADAPSRRTAPACPLWLRGRVRGGHRRRRPVAPAGSNPTNVG